MEALTSNYGKKTSICKELFIDGIEEDNETKIANIFLQIFYKYNV